jgi:molybdate transport system substrate-binding protein
MTSFLRRILLACAALALLAAPTLAQLAATSQKAAGGKSQNSPFPQSVFPPWQHGANNDALARGLVFTVPRVDDLADFHGDPDDPRLVLYVGGNYFFAMAPLVKAFEAAHPEYKGRVYWETLPPGLLAKQIGADGRVTVGNMTWTAKPDAYFADLKKVNGLIDQGLLVGPAVPYATNDLTIMVPKGNPAHIASLSDLGRPGIRLAMPNPEFEGVARQIKIALTKTGGDALEKTVYDTKVKDGTTTLTQIHHRQTPLLIMRGRADAGVTWQSEAEFQEQVGHPISHVAIPVVDNATAIYAGAEVRGASHPQAAKAWLGFIRSPEALKMFERYGFKPYLAN